MRSRIILLIILVFLVISYRALFPFFEKSRSNIRKVEVKGLILPPVFVRLLSLEFRTIAADLLFVRVSQFYGGKVERKELAKKEDWEWLHRNLDVITELDPYFEDPYYFGNALLTWDARMIDEANDLLKKGTRARTWDWQLPFFLGFNYFYFLNENKAGADYLLQAYERPGSWSFLPTLAARLYNNEGKTETAIAVLRTFWESEKNEKVRKKYEIRIDALRKILSLENALERYRKITGKYPEDLQVLIRSNIIPAIPRDPYGGTFYIDKDGSIKTTSKLAFKPKPQGQADK